MKLEEWYQSVGGDEEMNRLDLRALFGWSIIKIQSRQKKQEHLKQILKKSRQQCCEEEHKPREKANGGVWLPIGKEVTTHFGARGMSDYTAQRRKENEELSKETRRWNS